MNMIYLYLRDLNNVQFGRQAKIWSYFNQSEKNKSGYIVVSVSKALLI